MTKEIADYDKYKYDYEKYWQNPGVNRDYEDMAERRVLPKKATGFVTWELVLAGFLTYMRTGLRT